jgi:hypothetical protein
MHIRSIGVQLKLDNTTTQLTVLTYKKVISYDMWVVIYTSVMECDSYLGSTEMIK